MATRTRTLLIAVCVLAALVLAANGEESIGVVIYAEGVEISVYRNGTLEAHQLRYEDVLGLPLYRGDMIQTADDTFLEIQLLPARNILKVAENTTFQLTDLKIGGSGAFDVTYGRVRAKVHQLSRSQSFQLRGRTAIAGVRGTDFGYDLIAERDGRVRADIYCFEGSVEITPTEARAEKPAAGEGAAGDAAPDDASTDAAQPTPTGEAEPPTETVTPIIIGANQMVRIKLATTDDREETSISQEAVEQEIVAFWNENDFQQRAIEADEIRERFPDLRGKVLEERGIEPEFLRTEIQSLEETSDSESPAVEPVPVAPEEDDELSPEEVERRREIRRKFNRAAGWVVTVSGVAVGGAGVAIEYFGDELLPNEPLESRESLGRGMMVYGGILLATGVVSFIMSLF